MKILCKYTNISKKHVSICDFEKWSKKTLKNNKNIILVFANNMYLPVYSMYVFGKAEVTESVEKAYEDFQTFI